MDIANKTAVITGASRGIGAAMAREFAARGMKLGLCARGPIELPPGATGDRVITAELDVADGDAIDDFAHRVADTFGHIALWINNAGVLAPIGPLRDIDSTDFRRHIDTNITGVFHGSRAYVRHLHQSRGPGVLINISSGAATMPFSGWSVYCAGKAAVNMLTDCIRVEETAIDLRAHAVAPGIIDTDMQALIRAQSPDAFPDVERFRQLKVDNAFSSAESVARDILTLAFDPRAHTDDVAIRFPLAHS